MSQLQTLQDIYSKIAAIQQKICLEDSDVFLTQPPSFFEEDEDLKYGGAFVFSNTSASEMLNNLLEPFAEGMNFAIDAANLNNEEILLLSETLKAQFRVIERITLPKRILEEVIIKLLIESILAIMLGRLIKGIPECYTYYQEINDLSGSQVESLNKHKLLLITITDYPNTFGKIFSGNENVPDYLIEPIYITFFEDDKGWTEPIRVRFLSQKIPIPDCSNKVAVIASELITYTLRMYR